MSPMLSTLRRLAVLAAAAGLTAAPAGADPEPGADPAPTPAPTAEPEPAGPVATFTEYGPVHLGMTEQAAAAAVGSAAVEHRPEVGCTILGGGDDADALRVLVADGTGAVTVIRTPPGTRTDRDVGDGSTVAQVRDAYPEPPFRVETGDVGGQGAPGLIVYAGPGADAPLLGFIVEDGLVGPPTIGRAPAAEGC